MNAACAGCEDSFQSSELKDVGGHSFCAACFDNLLKPAPVQKLAPVELTFERLSEVDAAPSLASELCFVCQKPMPTGPDTTLGGLGICQACREGLTLRIPEDEPADVQTSEPVEELPPGPMYTPGSTSVQCAACPKMMPGPGSYHEVNGAAYCPECFYAGKILPAEDVSADPIAAPVQAKVVQGPTAGAGEHCDACMRPLVANEFERISGFRICQACTSSNKALALGIAKVRHERFLRQMAEKLT